jgi:hypothetical protein
MNVDPVVRSIRIATTLNDRFGVIVREANEHQTVAEFERRSAKRNGSIGSGAISAMRAPRVRQARHRVTHYDELRATERRGNKRSTTSASMPVSIRSRSRSAAPCVEMKVASFNREDT